MASFLVLALLALPLSAGFPAYPGVDEDVQMAAIFGSAASKQ